MPNQRRAGQTFVGFQSDDDFVKSLDDARGRDSRSLFIRMAVAEKLRSLGFEVSDDLVFPADRVSRVADDNAPPPATVRKSVNYREALKKDARTRRRKKED